jgi:hypothetical protein
VPHLQAVVLADHLYRDAATGKHVVAGTFHQLNVPEVPAQLPRSIGVFLVLTGLPPSLELELRFTNGSGEPIMLMDPLRVTGGRGDEPLEIGLEVPPLPLPRVGLYRLEVRGDGELLGAAPVEVRLADGQP